ncbi:MAG: sulfurtransferase [Candidatus Eremiobacteraeota bacterium]|nr:sulfurtransferase [Candidatus Eremiobacteraeota bacterium]MBV8354076.1 sulfurtransferase [Candidatus Eremiobacteraeota bacterium]
MALFVEVDWLQRHLADPNVVVVDTRSTPHGAPGQRGLSGREQYAIGHLPGAIHLDYAEDLHDLATPYAARVAPPERFADVIGGAGIGEDSYVVAYDEGTVPYAARLVWMLAYYGHERAAILAGGTKAWTAAGLPLVTDAPVREPRRFTPRPHVALRASKDEVLAVAEGRSDAQLLETQRDATYALRDRDIRGTRRVSGSELLEDARGGRIAEPARLRELLAGLDPGKRTIVSCGSGVSASGAFFALREAGFSDVAVYDGSWMEWSYDRLPTVPKES